MTTTTEVHEVLVQARALIADPERWCKGAVARTADGQWVPPGSNDAVKWCADGAVARSSLAYPLSVAVEAHRVLDHTALDSWSYMPTTLNDNPDTHHAEILTLFDRAIEATKP